MTTSESQKNPTLPLTPRELQVLILMANGKHNKEIAPIMGITEHTAKFHVNQILAKTNQGTRLGAVIFCLKQGIIKLDTLMPEILPDVINSTTPHTSTKEENDNMKDNLLEDIMESVEKRLADDRFTEEAMKNEIKEALNVYFP